MTIQEMIDKLNTVKDKEATLNVIVASDEPDEEIYDSTNVSLDENNRIVVTINPDKDYMGIY
ncbi:hypothetical protein EKK58_09460 [Candidatus Dependentiae bacterium]|nr:MAG: hypothetical protein EKK58_09460 [Candidatus Dependentiae bacterium]